MNNNSQAAPSGAGAQRIATAFDLYRRGELDRAREIFSEYMHDEVLGTDARRGLAVIAWQRRQPDSAIQLLKEAVRLAPDHSDARADLALTLMMAGQLEDSLEHWQRRLELAPNDAAAWHNFGKAFVDLKRYGEAGGAFERVLALDPNLVGTYMTYARAMQEAGDWTKAEAIWRRALQVPAAEQAGYIGLTGLLFKRGRLDEALEAYRQGVIRFPNSTDLRLGFAQLLEDFADKAGAEREYRKVLELDAGIAMALEGLLTLLRADAKDADLAAARNLLTDPQQPPKARANVGFGLGKALDAKGDPEGAMAVWATANAARREQAGAYDRDAGAQYIDRLIQAFSPEFFTRSRLWGVDDPRPVFVVGMPRSGTSLVEQILAAHPDAYGYGELPEIPKLAKSLPARTNSIQRWPEVVASLNSELTQQTAMRYLGALMDRKRVTAGRLIDKAPMNYHYVGLIFTLFPNAHVIWCRRDPRDIGVSIYGENFGLAQKYATDLSDIGFYIQQYARLMRHWQAQFGERLHICEYESMVSEPEAETRALVDAVGLPWNDQCLRYYEDERPVLTPSRWQVRSPIYKGAVQRWKRYGDALQPLISALGDELEGYTNG
ncbi:MAG: sulfotransferase [Abyssibacter sp.]|uniref:tetratricopeptide repeat-containing sulfotransferase family protein n=1 Tax=Abyssibacter sp. TaxID=2320200 RepID=UPI00321B309A